MIEIIQLALLIFIALALVIHIRNKPRTATHGRAIAMDSSALIDGRIVDIVSAGFAPSRIIIPRFILRELQLLADGSDSHKRERARFGLEVARQLQELSMTSVEIATLDFTDVKATDDKLTLLAQKVGADLCTTDYNLNKVATVEGVRVLNVNELANAMRPAALPGEQKEIKIIQRGSSKDQGVGYMDDGTMVVVAGAGSMIGKKVSIEVTRMLQTEAGKMLFARKRLQPSQQKRTR